MKKNNASLFLKSKKNLFLNTSGEHTSIFSGDGLDFKEIREYNSGDDIRHVNWNVTAKSGVPSVNIFNSDKQLNIVVVYLNSGSLYFGTFRSKQDTAIEAMTVLGNTAMKKNDLLTSIFFTTKEQKFYKATKNKQRISANIDTAYELDPIGNSVDYDKLNFYLLKKIKQKSLIFIIGDFLDIPDFIFLGKKHEVYCAIIRDQFEDDLKLMGTFNLVDTNNQHAHQMYLDNSSSKKYKKLMQEHDKKLFTHFYNSKIKYKKIFTNDDVIKELQKLIKA